MSSQYSAGETTKGLQFSRYFSKDGVSPLEEIVWEKRSASIMDENGKSVIFEMSDLEFPAGWSQLATDIVAEKYFKKKGVPDKGYEYSVKQLVNRVSEEIRDYGEISGYFASREDAQVFEDELKAILVNQIASFNSPVWFNVGLRRYGIKGDSDGEGYWQWDEKKREVVETMDTYAHPQGSACFINSVTDTLLADGGIYSLVIKEARLFKHGSGTGTNFSSIRGEGEALSGGGESSGLLSFLKINDRGADSVKSGGVTRRAAKMVIVDYDHPNIMGFIRWKAEEERKARVLIEYGGYTQEDALKTISGQNSNNSVRVTDEFMKGVKDDGEYRTRGRVDARVERELRNRDVFREIAQATYDCGDPGLQFHDTINDWHTCANTGKIRASNPCSEFMFLDDSACNLASINLRRVQNNNGGINVNALNHTVDVMITAQEIIVDLSSYPGKDIARNSHRFRPLGLGFANLGALLMTEGLPYDSEEGRSMAGVIMANITGRAYLQSAIIAEQIGSFEGFEENREPFLRVMGKHRTAIDEIKPKGIEYLVEEAKKSWDEAIRFGGKYGFRNAQATVLAPTGTIGFMMDCDTTGIEPDFSLIKGKKLAGGGFIEIVNQSVEHSLRRLGYSEDQTREVITYINTETKSRKRGTIEGAPWLRPEHYSIFDCANRSGSGTRFIASLGHIKMMEAVQPFVSGAISKTVNAPNETSVGEIEGLYFEAWRRGLKAIAIYRDGSKVTQPLGTLEDALKLNMPKKFGERRRLEGIRDGETHKATIAGHDIVVRFGNYPDGSLGEIFVDMFKEGTELRTALHNWAISSSKAMQYGMSPEKFVDTFLHVSDTALSGMVQHPFIHQASSVYDLVARIVGVTYLGRTDLAQVEEEAEKFVHKKEKDKSSGNGELVSSKGVCSVCNSTFGTQTGTCWTCLNCGTNQGCG